MSHHILDMLVLRIKFIQSLESPKQPLSLIGVQRGEQVEEEEEVEEVAMEIGSKQILFPFYFYQNNK